MRRITKTVFLVLNILASLAFLLACLAPYLDPKKWWLISLIGLAFAFIMVTLIAFMFFWLLLRPRYILISLIPLLIGWKSISPAPRRPVPRGRPPRGTLEKPRHLRQDRTRVSDRPPE